ncbi:MAG TPA: D-aminoacyl-tRNA deacylase [Anaerolineales bacterium]
MRIVIQRVLHSKVIAEGKTIAEIGRGFLILLGIAPDDGRPEAEYLAEKCAFLRIFEDSEGKTNLSIQDIKGEALVVSQFTLYADARKGRRPSFTDAAPPEIAEPLVRYFSERLNSIGVPTRTGSFGAHMRVELVNDGPFTILLESPVE